MATRTKRYIDLYINGKQVENDIKSVNDAMRKLRNEQARMTIGSEKYVQKAKEIRKLKGILSQHRADINKTKSGWLSLGKAANGFNKYFGIITAVGASLLGVAYSTQEWIKGNVGLSDSLANVMKTTGLTRKEVRELYTDFKYMNTRIPRKELLGLAEEAGRLGKKGKKDIMAFVEVANKISVALGDDFGGEAQKATLEVGKLTDNLKVGAEYGVDFGEAMEKVGSGINEVAANSKAQAPYMVEWMKRTQGLGKLANLTAADIMGYAATFDESGQAVEMSATAINKLVVDMFTDSSEYAKVAGISTKEFAELVETDANAALIKMLEGLKGNNDGLGIMVKKFDAMDIDGTRATQALASVVGNLDRLKINQKTANKAMEEGTSLMNEYNIKNENLAGNVERLSRFIRGKFINSGMVEYLEQIVGKMTKWTEIKLSEKLEDERIELRKLESKVYDTNTKYEDRIKLIKKMSDDYPELLGNIDAEKISNEDLRNKLTETNEVLKMKILLQQKEEETSAKNEIALGKGVDRMIQEDKLRGEMLKIQEKYNLEKRTEGTLMEKADFAFKKLNEYQKENSSMAKNNIAGFARQQEINSFNLKLQKLRDLMLQEEEYSNQAKRSEIERDDLENFYYTKNFGLSRAEYLEKLKNDKASAESAEELIIIEAEARQAAIDAAVEANKKAAEDNKDLLYRKWIDEGERALAELELQAKEMQDIISKAKEPKENEEEEALDSPEMLRAVEATIKKNYEVRRKTALIDYENRQIDHKQYWAVIAQIDTDEKAALDEANATWADKNMETIMKVAEYTVQTLQVLQQALSVYHEAKAAQDAKELDRFVTNQDLEKESLERRLKAGELSRKKYSIAVEKLDKQLEAKQKELQYREDKRRWQSSLLASVVNVAQGITAALSLMPPANFIMAGITGVLGAAQIGVIAANPPKKYAKGGFTKGEETYIAGEDGNTEYIAPGWQVNDPTLGPIIQDLDRIRTGKNPNHLLNSNVSAIPSSRAVDVASRMGAGDSYSSSSTQSTVNHYSQSSSDNTNQQMLNEIRIMNRYLSDPKNRRATINHDLQIQHNEEMDSFNSLSVME